MKRGNYMNVFSPEEEKNFHFFLGDSINTNTEVLLLRHH